MTRITSALWMVDRRCATMKLVRPCIIRGEGLLNLQLGARVDGGRRLVENQHRRQAEHHAGDAQQLLLPLRELAARSSLMTVS